MYTLFLFQFRSEFRRKSIFLSLVLYLIALVFINYLSIGIQHRSLSPGIWSALFWMAMLSTLIHVVAKSFMGDKQGTMTYLYSLASPGQIILSRIFYNFFLCAGIAFTGYVFFAFWLNNPIEDTPLFILTLLLASFGFSSTLSILSAIASKTNNGNVIMAVLSFPILIGILLMSIKITKNCIDGLEWEASATPLMMLVGINLLASAFTYLLFPYIWRS
ncbi:MAG: heme exporter protein CcmB [Cyclobacteriaceae bacterium]|nr:heme exporter protein CcmB [Cyclobacteriaceae bacterium]